MRKKLTYIFELLIISVGLIITASIEAYAQEYENTPVTISKEKVKVGGSVCYSHIVLEKQTLYSISKAYNVTIEELYQYNPKLKEEGLKKNSILLIPSAENSKAEPKVTQEQKIVKKKVHIRKWYEDLDMIAAQYNVSVEDIMAANNLKDQKLTNRQKLTIPTDARPYRKVEDYNEQHGEIQDTEGDISAEVQDISIEESDSILIDTPSEPIKVSTLLPLRNMEGKLSRNNMDFYSGVMLAVHDLAEKGISIDINTYDISDKGNPVTTEDLENRSFILGPVSAADQTRLLQTAGELNAVISPLDPRSERLAYEFNEFIQAPTPHKIQYQDLTNWIQEELKDNDKVIMFSERTARTNNTVELMKEVMDSSGIAHTTFTYSILEGRDILDSLKYIMTPDGSNRIYVASESEAFVNDVIRNLNLMLLENYEIVLYAPARFRNYETIEVEHFHKTSMRVSLNYFINYEERAVKDFLMKYRAIYNTEPSQFAFQGYDLAYYFITLCNKYGEDWIQQLDGTKSAMLQSTFDFSKLGTGGYVNTGVRRIVYGPKWTVTQIR